MNKSANFSLQYDDVGDILQFMRVVEHSLHLITIHPRWLVPNLLKYISLTLYLFYRALLHLLLNIKMIKAIMN